VIQYNPKSWWGLIFKFHRSDTFRVLAPAMLTVALYSGFIAYVYEARLVPSFQGTTLVHSLLGFVISLLLVFRTNTAYERWWEGRRHWGALVNASRNLALKLDAALPAEHLSRKVFADLLSDYAAVLCEHLRDIPISRRDPHISHAPNAVAAALFREFDRLMRRGDLSGIQGLAMNPELTAFSDICGACERIRKTPIPYGYSLFIKKFIFAYIVTMPLCLVHDFGYWIVAMTTFEFYVLVSLEVIAEEVENPFGRDANDLPTNDIAATIAANMREILTPGNNLET
jgi:putative membrane protein